MQPISNRGTSRNIQGGFVTRELEIAGLLERAGSIPIAIRGDLWHAIVDALLDELHDLTQQQIETEPKAHTEFDQRNTRTTPTPT